MVTVAKQKSITLSNNTVSDIIITGVNIISKEHNHKDCCSNSTKISDIDVVDKVSGATLVFDALTNQFNLEIIPFVDGGSF